MKPLLKEIQHNKLLWLLAFVPGGVRGRNTPARRAYAALRAVRPGHRAAGRPAQSRHRIGGGQDGGCGRWPAQCHAGKSDGTGHRAHRLARRAICAGQGVACRRDRHQHVVHAGRVPSPRRTQISRPGIQPRQRPHASGPALPGNRRPVDSFGRLSSRLCRGGGVHPAAERRSVRPAHRRLRVGHVLFPEDAPGTVRQCGVRGGRPHAVADGAGPGDAGRRHRAGGAGERDFCRVGAEGGGDVRHDPGVRGLHRRRAGRRRGGNGVGVLGSAQEPAGLERRASRWAAPPKSRSSSRRCWCS